MSLKFIGHNIFLYFLAVRCCFTISTEVAVTDRDFIWCLKHYLCIVVCQHSVYLKKKRRQAVIKMDLGM